MIGGDLLFVSALRACNSIGGNRLCGRSPACEYARALLCALFMVTVNIRILGSIVPVALSGSLVWWDST